MAHPKGLLIERAQKLGLDRPEFNTAKTGPEHEPSFITDATLNGQVIGTGQGRSKKDSEKFAAEEALAWLEQGGANTTDSTTAKSTPTKRKASAKGDSAAAKTSTGPARKQAAPAPAAASGQADLDADQDDEDDEFTGPWPMFDDLLASVVQVAERRVSADLRGPQAMEAIRDFSLQLYKELLADLGEVVDEDEDDED